MLAVLVAFAPFAVASDPTSEPVCVEDTCAGPGDCVPDVACVPRSCGVAMHCRGDLEPGFMRCSVNETIDGRTCQTSVGLSGHVEREVSAPAVGRVAMPAFEASAGLSNGSVDEQHLPNSWVTPEANLTASAAGLDTGAASVRLYRSVILLEGTPNGISQLVQGDRHTYSQIALEVSREGGTIEAPQYVVVGVILLDSMPEDCFVESSSDAIAYRCRPGPSLP